MLKVEYRRVEDLIPYARNARTHSDEQIAQIAASIKEFGWTNPILIDGENGIIAGHGRLAAARKLKMDKVPCIELSGLTEAQKKAYILADNRLPQNAGWDYDLLKIELQDLGDIDKSTIGFTEEEINAIFAKETDYIDAVTEENFSSIDSMIENEKFQVTLLFDKENKAEIEEFIRENGKDFLSAILLKAIRNA